MREFELDLSEVLKNGLTPEYNIPNNFPFLLECFGFKCGKYGLEPAEEFTSNYSFSSSISWPKVQVLKGEKYTVYVYSDAGVALAAVHDYNTNTLMFSNTIDASDTLFELADFGNYAIIMNGSLNCFVIEITSGYPTDLLIGEPTEIAKACT